VPFMQADELRETSSRRRKFFPHVTAYVVAVPTYVGGFMTLGWSAKDAEVAATPVETIRSRAERAGILGTTLYWTPAIHVGAFNLPPYIARHLPAD
jgi:spermidine synthase